MYVCIGMGRPGQVCLLDVSFWMQSRGQLRQQIVPEWVGLCTFKCSPCTNHPIKYESFFTMADEA